jgi:hypothetical protein
MTDTVTPLRPAAARKKDPTNALRQRRHRAKRKAAPAVTPSVAAAETPNEIKETITAWPTRPGVAVDRLPARNAAAALPYLAAVGLAAAAAWFSIRGMVVLFPGSPVSVICMAVAMESAKLVTVAWLSSHWRATAWFWRVALVVLVSGLAAINGVGVFSQLVAAHVGDRGAAAALVETQDATLAARIEVAAAHVVDLDRQIAQLDAAVAAVTQRGKASAGLSAVDSQRKVRAGLASEREEAAATLATLKADRAQVAAKGRQAEIEAAPIVYIAELLGNTGESERVIRWLIGLMVMCCDPLAISLTAAASARRKTKAQALISG